MTAVRGVRGRDVKVGDNLGPGVGVVLSFEARNDHPTLGPARAAVMSGGTLFGFRSTMTVLSDSVMFVTVDEQVAS